MNLSVRGLFSPCGRLANRNSSGSIACQIIVLKADVELREQGVVNVDALGFSAAGSPCTQFHLLKAARVFPFAYVPHP
jgi:hypothetical protein